MTYILKEMANWMKNAKRVAINSLTRTFKPKEFGEINSLFSLGTMSMSYWDLAEELKDRVIVEIDSHKSGVYSKYAFPSIVMYCSAVEALINESLSLKKSQTTDHELAQSLDSMRYGLGDERDFLVKARNAFAALSKDKTISLDENILQNSRALSEVRNAIVHYNPDFIDTLNWPIRLQEALKRSKVEPIMGDWTITFRTKEIVIWASTTSKSILQEFLKVTNYTDVNHFFNTQ